MRINSFSNISFKYNRSYHNQLQKKLIYTHSPSDEKQRLVQRDKELLKVEDEILKKETSLNLSEKEKEELIQEILRYIRDKSLLANRINKFFDNDDYCDDLIEQYKKEAEMFAQNSISYIWRIKLCEQLEKVKLSVDNLLNEVWESQDELEEILEIPPKALACETSSKNIQEYAPSSGEVVMALDNKLILHQRTQSSPKGFSDVVGMDDIKRDFQENIIEYVLNPQQAKIDEEEYGIRPPRGYLFWGPPGCGKTFVVEALAAECGLQMFKMNVSQIGGIHVNESANNLEKAFNYLAKVAKKSDKPVLLFMDEVDSLARSREKNTNSSEDAKTITTLLKHIEAARDNNLIIFAATNKFDILDDAFVSRFDSVKYIGLPKKEQINNLLKKYLLKRSKGVNLGQDEVSIEFLSRQLLGYSNRSIVFILDEACKIAKRDNRSEIKTCHIEQAIKNSDFQKIDEKHYKKQTAKPTKIGFN